MIPGSASAAAPCLCLNRILLAQGFTGECTNNLLPSSSATPRM
ncbi:hypothetical protein ACOBR2_02570 [Telmatobacter bradus]